MLHTANSTVPVSWDLPALYQPPATFAAPEVREEGVTSVYFAGLPFQGRPTRVFAMYGVPEAARPVPGMVLVHGGGGTAFAEWVRLWNRRGYAAIAMDLNGQLPIGTYGNWTRHAWAGPLGICEPEHGGMSKVDWPVTDQWPYHAVGAVLGAHSLLRALPGVDAGRIGVTGISWGGYTTCLISALDARFLFAVPVYGCGFLGENSAWLEQFTELGLERAGRWLGLWDPKHYLPHAAMPMLWVSGTNDFAYPMDSLAALLPAAHHPAHAVPPRAHGACPWRRRGRTRRKSLPAPGATAKMHRRCRRFSSQQRRGRDVSLTYRSYTPITHAELNYTADNGPWPSREWHSLPAQLDGEHVSATLPADAVVYYLNLFDDRECAVSSEHELVE